MKFLRSALTFAAAYVITMTVTSQRALAETPPLDILSPEFEFESTGSVELVTKMAELCLASARFASFDGVNVPFHVRRVQQHLKISFDVREKIRSAATRGAYIMGEILQRYALGCPNIDPEPVDAYKEDRQDGEADEGDEKFLANLEAREKMTPGSHGAESLQSEQHDLIALKIAGCSIPSNHLAVHATIGARQPTRRVG